MQTFKGLCDLLADKRPDILICENVVDMEEEKKIMEKDHSLKLKKYFGRRQDGLGRGSQEGVQWKTCCRERARAWLLTANGSCACVCWQCCCCCKNRNQLKSLDPQPWAPWAQGPGPKIRGGPRPGPSPCRLRPPMTCNYSGSSRVITRGAPV